MITTNCGCYQWLRRTSPWGGANEPHNHLTLLLAVSRQARERGILLGVPIHQDVSSDHAACTSIKTSFKSQQNTGVRDGVSSSPGVHQCCQGADKAQQSHPTMNNAPVLRPTRTSISVCGSRGAHQVSRAWPRCHAEQQFQQAG